MTRLGRLWEAKQVEPDALEERTFGHGDKGHSNPGSIESSTGSIGYQNVLNR